MNWAAVSDTSIVLPPPLPPLLLLSLPSPLPRLSHTLIACDTARAALLKMASLATPRVRGVGTGERPGLRSQGSNRRSVRWRSIGGW